MCLGIYLASGHELRLVPWTPEKPAFNVKLLNVNDRSVKAQFTLEHIYYLGAHTSCACGFSPSEEPDEADRRASVQALMQYLREAAAHGPLEMFACWDGDYETAPRRRLALRPDEFGENGDWTNEGSFVTIARDAA